ncbi:MAG: sulfatase [Planctomycetes bacterium]|nr:sulfatase [Planctomycetota bacterium]
MRRSWLGVLLLGCGACDDPAPARPNVLWVVWDTARADHMSLYGYPRPTTPFVDRWAKDARVFDDCMSASCWTVPSHASMFTGLLPAEHGAMHGNEYLDDGLETVAETLQRAGYQTFAWAANPHVSVEENFLQGFEVQQHPWDPQTLERAVEIFKRKVPESIATRELQSRQEKRGSNPWVVKAAGELGREGFAGWLDQRDSERPFLAFFNFMEAHRPLIPPRELREKLLSPEEVEATYAREFNWKDLWAYCFGWHEYSPEDLKLLRDTYDAALLELDALFAGLIAELEARGLSENTLVILTADHGENLGDLHLLDHQYSLNQALIRVPLAIRYPPRFAPGRESRPVMTMDLHPTLLELAGVTPPKLGVQHARSLFAPSERRVRVADYSQPFPGPLASARGKFPDRDIARFERGLMTIVDGRWKLVRELGGPAHLYDLSAPGDETRDVAGEHPEVLERMRAGMGHLLKSLTPIGVRSNAKTTSEQHQRMLELLGYAGGDEQADGSAPDGEQRTRDTAREDGATRERP